MVIFHRYVKLPEGNENGFRGCYPLSMDWFLGENLNRKPWFLPSNCLGFPVKIFPSSNSMTLVISQFTMEASPLSSMINISDEFHSYVLNYQVEVGGIFRVGCWATVHVVFDF